MSRHLSAGEDRSTGSRQQRKQRHQRSFSAPEATPQRRRRTYTTNQFELVWRPAHQRTTGESFRERRPCSPNRHNNPHPLGLTYQAAYNRDSNVFGSWNPSLNLILQGLSSKVDHANGTNFTAGYKNDQYTDKMSYGNLEDVKLPPKYRSLTSVSYQAPSETKLAQDRSIPISRYGSDIDRMCSAHGIVPSTLRPFNTDRWRKPPCNHNLTAHKSF